MTSPHQTFAWFASMGSKESLKWRQMRQRLRCRRLRSVNENIDNVKKEISDEIDNVKKEIKDVTSKLDKVENILLERQV